MRFGYDKYDSKSYQIGALVCFSEMIAAKVKKLAFSGAVSEENLADTEALIQQICNEFNIKYHVEYNLIRNNIAEDAYTEGKYIIFLYEDDEVLEKYNKLKKKQEQAVKDGKYTDNIRKEITIELCRLLSYPEEGIREKFM